MINTHFGIHGYESFAGVVGPHGLRTVIQELEYIVDTGGGDGAVRQRRGRTFAIRNALALAPQMRALAVDGPMHERAREILGSDARPIRATLFDKTPQANWVVPWHQDTAIPVKERMDGVPGFGVWSVKAGQDYCEAPTEVLRRIVALRLHLDPCGPDNGPLRVIPGSHGEGRLTTEKIESWKSNNIAVTVCAQAGDVLAMAPLLLHSSSPANQPNHRRILHVEYAVGPLPGGLQWASVG